MDLLLYSLFLFGAGLTSTALFGLIGPMVLAIAGAAIYLRAQTKAKTAESWEATARATQASATAWKEELELQRTRADRLVGVVEQATEAQRLAVEKVATANEAQRLAVAKVAKADEAQRLAVERLDTIVTTISESANVDELKENLAEVLSILRAMSEDSTS